MIFRIASSAREYEQIAALAYATFVEEIPQHPPNRRRSLQDRFHDENTYIIAINEDRVIGMIVLRDRRPFSLDEKLSDLDRYLPPSRSICEVRLLAIRREARRALVLRGLLREALIVGRERGHDLAIISGTTRQLNLYRRLGFVPFGPRVGKNDAQFQSMYLTLEAYRSSPLRRMCEQSETRHENR